MDCVRRSMVPRGGISTHCVLIWGTFREVLRPGRYTVSFRLQTNVDKEESYPDAPQPRRPIWRRGIGGQAHGIRAQRLHNLWGAAPAKVSLRTSLGEEVARLVRFEEEGCLEKSDAPVFIGSREKATEDWMECHVGEFTVAEEDNDDNGSQSLEVDFAMEEIEVLVWKQGLVLDGVMLRPSCCVHPPHSQIPQSRDMEDLTSSQNPQHEVEMCGALEQLEMCGVPSIHHHEEGTSHTSPHRG